MKKLSLGITLFVLLGSLSACGIDSEDASESSSSSSSSTVEPEVENDHLIYYLQADGTYYVGGDNNYTTDTSLVIPLRHNGKLVTGIKDEAFSYYYDSSEVMNYYHYKTITLPNSIKYIGNRAFFGCVDVTKINIPDGVTNIGNFAFSRMMALEELLIPSSVSSLGTAFDYNPASLKIYFDLSLSSIETLCPHFNDNSAATFYFLSNTGSTYYNGKRYASYSEALDGVMGYYAIGFNGLWNIVDETYRMSKITIADVYTISSSLGSTLSSKPYVALYKTDITIEHEDVDWTKKALINDELENVNGKYCFKVVKARYDTKDAVYVNEQWIPDPADTGNGYNVEALTSNIFVPTYQQEQDAYGFSWADEPILISGEEGAYTFIFALYPEPQTWGQAGAGIALIKK